MKFVELKNHLLTKNFYHCYNLFGDDSFLLDSAKNLILNYAASKEQFDRIFISAENFNSKNVLAILSTSSFFGGIKTVVLSGVEKTKNKEILSFLEAYSTAPNPQAIFVVISNEQLCETENFKGNFLCNIDCNRLDRNMIERWVLTELGQKNATITDQALNILLDYTNEYLSRISLELNKLVAYTSGNIKAGDVKLLVSKELEYSVYELTENLGNNNKQETFEILNQMMSDKKAAPYVLSLIQTYFRRMFFCAISTKTNAQIAAELNIKEYAVKKAKETSKLFSKVALKDIVEKCNDIDQKVKSGQTSYKNAVDYLVMQILILNKKNQ